MRGEGRRDERVSKMPSSSGDRRRVLLLLALPCALGSPPA